MLLSYQGGQGTYYDCDDANEDWTCWGAMGDLDRDSDRLNGFEVRVGDVDNWASAALTNCGSTHGDGGVTASGLQSGGFPGGTSLKVQCNGLMARYVFVGLDSAAAMAGRRSFEPQEIDVQESDEAAAERPASRPNPTRQRQLGPSTF